MEYFATAGINVKPPNQFDFDSRNSVLEVRATTEELDIIAAALQDLVSPAPQQILLEGSIVEMSPAVGKELGLDWFRDSFFIQWSGSMSPLRRGNPYQFTITLLTSQVDVVARAMGVNPGVRVMPTQLDRSLLVFLTPTIVDADGNRVHPPDRLPYDSNSIPPQNVR
jgi:type II secretory pathway component GspD/PulD (secretin)